VVRFVSWLRQLPTLLGCGFLLGLLNACGPVHAGAPLAPAVPGRTTAAVPSRVAAGVTLGATPLGGLDPRAARTAIEGLTATLAVPPQNAYVDPSTRGIVPGLNGWRLDVPATLQRALTAPAGSDIAPVLQPVPPAVTPRDLPPLPIYHASRQRYAVAFLINVAWGESHLPAMLSTLSRLHAPATFCLVGRWAEQHPELVHAITAASRAAATPFAFCNHGYRDHGWQGLDEAQAAASIAQADAVIARLTGTKPLYFSPHKGEFNPAVLRASRAQGHELVLWSVDTIDWQHPSPGRILDRVLGRLQPGDIVLMHPTATTAAALPALIAGARAKGLRLETLNQLLSPERTT
jgi:peptidoglycan/xylan/chitin deacetylase (PgdA/CDA1 family)